MRCFACFHALHDTHSDAHVHIEIREAGELIHKGVLCSSKCYVRYHHANKISEHYNIYSKKLKVLEVCTG